MNNKTNEKLKHFAGLDTWSSFHPLDTERFNDFISEAYRNKDFGISHEEFLAVFPNLNEHLERIASKLYGRYENGIELLRQFHKNS
ncbi:MAG: hypothetical protein Q8Q92_04595 [bacterium]|nr:hypothetical protein [bacterium]